MRNSVRFVAGGLVGVALLCGANVALAADGDANKISFEQIYAAPDDVALNLQYARQAVKAGDLLAAAGALERLLLTTPDADSARFFYAQVLYRMDDKQAAAREFDQLDSRALSPAHIKALAAYRKALAKAQS